MCKTGNPLPGRASFAGVFLQAAQELVAQDSCHPVGDVFTGEARALGVEVLGIVRVCEPLRVSRFDEPLEIPLAFFGPCPE